MGVTGGWQSTKSAPPGPIEPTKAWLIYHGEITSCNVSIPVSAPALLALERPGKSSTVPKSYFSIRAKSNETVRRRSQRGLPCAALVDGETDKWPNYYGGADTSPAWPLQNFPN
jgi:beta-1,4-mannooligosaccharide/beta-1,4-mannosyl-N-acetylglucosamine phosphorylase